MPFKLNSKNIADYDVLVLLKKAQALLSPNYQINDLLTFYIDNTLNYNMEKVFAYTGLDKSLLKLEFGRFYNENSSINDMLYQKYYKANTADFIIAIKEQGQL